MGDRLIIDIADWDSASLTVWRDGELPAASVPVPFRRPLADGTADELRWYLEDYLRMPYGVYRERGERIGAAIEGWGVELFESVFASGPARDAYHSFRGERRTTKQLLIRSAAAAPLALPWELMQDPAHGTPLSLDWEISRGLPAAGIDAAFAIEGERLPMLMVVSRPAAARDVGYRIIARPLVEHLQRVRDRVDVVVLRPPTLAQLERELAAAHATGAPFQIVHFDGHGTIAGTGTREVSPDRFSADSVEGLLAFEKAEGGADLVPARQVAEVLRAAQVPVVVLNACQSGAVTDEVGAAVATRLLQEGVGSIVAMSYSIYATAAAEFMRVFYERLFAGDSISSSVTAGRRCLYARQERISPAGALQLADWLVPVHYVRREAHFPQLRPSPGAQVTDEPSATADPLDQLAPTERFVGRDALFYELELAAALQRVVVLHGLGGVGKTEAAKAFGRWWQDTGGVDRADGVIFHSFEPGTASYGLDGVVGEIGLRLFGPPFAQLNRERRHALVDEALEEQRLLLIWDNFESAHSMPDPRRVTPVLDDNEREELRGFVQRLVRSGQTSLLITSRTEEAWLGEVRRIPLLGLDADEAVQYADQILRPYPNTRAQRARPGFVDLLKWLDGHPLAMRLVLPHLQTSSAQKLLADLRGETGASQVSRAPSGRLDSLDACVAYSFDQLSAERQKLLVAGSLFRGIVDPAILAAMSEDSEVPARFRSVTEVTWQETIEEAAAVGLLTRLDYEIHPVLPAALTVLFPATYLIHPALPAALAARWRLSSEHYEEERAAARAALLHAFAELCDDIVFGLHHATAELALAQIERHHHNLGEQLGYALDRRQWAEAQSIAQPLIDYFHIRSLEQEAQAWSDLVRVAVEGPDGSPPDISTPAGTLWILHVGSQAIRDLDSGDLSRADTAFRTILALLDERPDDPELLFQRAVTYRQAGRLASKRGRLDEAERLFRTALTIEESREDWGSASATYGELGHLASSRGELDEAEQWYEKVIATAGEYGDMRGLASAHFALGTMHEARGTFDEAERHLLLALATNQALGDSANAASVSFSLGRLAHRQGRMGVAHQRYLQALLTYERLGDKRAAAPVYHQLGMLARHLRQHDEARAWYETALSVFQPSTDAPELAMTYGELGYLAEAEGNVHDAFIWRIRALTLFDEFPHPATGSIPDSVRTMTAEAGIALLEATWLEVTGEPLPAGVRGYVQQSDQRSADASES